MRGSDPGGAYSSPRTFVEPLYSPGLIWGYPELYGAVSEADGVLLHFPPRPKRNQPAPTPMATAMGIPSPSPIFAPVLFMLHGPRARTIPVRRSHCRISFALAHIILKKHTTDFDKLSESYATTRSLTMMQTAEYAHCILLFIDGL
jgi:hypothetical protein